MVDATTAGSYSSTVEAHALSTGPAGSNAEPSAATLTVSAPPSGGGGGTLTGTGLAWLAGLAGALRLRAAKDRRSAKVPR
jgi:hypothetical protein